MGPVCSSPKKKTNHSRNYLQNHNREIQNTDSFSDALNNYYFYTQINKNEFSFTTNLDNGLKSLFIKNCILEYLSKDYEIYSDYPFSSQSQTERILFQIFISFNQKNKDFLKKTLLDSPEIEFRWLIYLSFVYGSNKFEFIDEQAYFELNKGDITVDINNLIKNDLKVNVNYEYLPIEASKIQERLLKALSNLDQDILYNSQMNALVVNLLIISDFRELEIINLINFIFSKSHQFKLREFFIEDSPKAVLYTFYIKSYLKENYNLIANKIEKIKLKDETWIIKWLQGLFACILPLKYFLRLLDCLFALGIEFIINFSVALLVHFKDRICIINNEEEFLKIFQFDLSKPELIEAIIKRAQEIKITKSFFIKNQEWFNNNKQKIKIFSNLESKSLKVSTYQKSINEDNDILRCKTQWNKKNKELDEIDLEFEGDLEKIKIEWEIETRRKEVELKIDLDKSN